MSLLDHTLSRILGVIDFGISASSLHLVRGIILHRLIHGLHRVLLIGALVRVLVGILTHLMIGGLIGLGLIVERLLGGIVLVGIGVALTVFLAL